MSKQEYEIAKYSEVYQREDYKMGDARKLCAIDNLKLVKDQCKTHLDVGCGRGEMVKISSEMGYKSKGVEAVDYLTDGKTIIHGKAWELPFADGSFDLVTMFDVIEHILPEDCDRTILELGRVAKKSLFITAANYSSKSLGVELHVNRLPYGQWDAKFRSLFPDAKVTWLPRDHGTHSETWHIEL